MNWRAGVGFNLCLFVLECGGSTPLCLEFRVYAAFSICEIPPKDATQTIQSAVKPAHSKDYFRASGLIFIVSR